MKQVMSVIMALVLLMTATFSAVGVQAASEAVHSANTGDISNAAVFIVVAVVALIFIVVSIVLSKKGKKK